MNKCRNSWIFAAMVCGFAGLGTAAGAQDEGPPPFERTEEREDCSNYNTQKNVYWGDLHNHTSYSSDVVVFGVWNDPRRNRGCRRGTTPERFSWCGDQGLIPGRLERSEPMATPSA